MPIPAIPPAAGGTAIAERLAFLLIWLLLALPAAAQENLAIPLTDGQGVSWQLQATLCRPAGDAPARLLVLNHGAVGSAEGRAAMAPEPCEHPSIGWFTSRGFAVLQPMRRGFGQTGGEWAEGSGRCPDMNFVGAGQESARDIAAAVAFGLAMPGIRQGDAVVAGHSAGGWAVLALAADPPPGVSALVNIAGGRGGPLPRNSCRNERLVEAAATFGRSARLPMLWLYADTDPLFTSDLAARLHAAFTAAGGNARLRVLRARGWDGHALFWHPQGAAVWGPPLARFLSLRPL